MTRTLSLAALLALAGCVETTDCTTEARASVELDVIDTDGIPIEGASAEYAILEEDWAAPEPCEAMPDGILVCGWELEATFEIWVLAEGYLSETVQVTVEADECHVITEVVEVTMEADGG